MWLSKRAVRRTGERRGVHHQHRVGRAHDDVRIVGGTGSQEGFVASFAGAVVLHPRGIRTAQLACFAHDIADLGLLPHDERRVDVVDHERELLRRLTPVGRAERAAELGRGAEAFEDAERVLSEPQDAIASLEAVGAQRVGQLVDPVVELGPRQPDVTVDHRQALRVAPSMLADDVADGQRMQQVDGLIGGHAA